MRLTADDIAEFSGIDGILKVLSEATADEWTRGRAWYRTAHRWTLKVAALSGKHPATVAAVLARLSPQVSWADNKAAAFQILCADVGCASQGVTSQCYPDNVIRAEDIARADNAETIALEVLPRKGYARPKISAFYRNIADPDIDGIATVDTWAIRVWRGDCLAPANTLTAKQSQSIQSDYCTAARAVGVLSHELQAIVWVCAHRLAREREQRCLFDIGLSFKI